MVWRNNYINILILLVLITIIVSLKVGNDEAPFTGNGHPLKGTGRLDRFLAKEFRMKMEENKSNDQ